MGSEFLARQHVLSATCYWVFDYWYLLAINIDDWYLCVRASRTEKGKGKPRWKQLSTQFRSSLVCVCVLVTQLCPTLCSPMNYNPPGSSSMGFSRQEYLSGLPCPSLGDLPVLGIELMSLMSPASAGGFFTTSATRGAPRRQYYLLILSLLNC